jgi:alkylhydroperoxidase/carboxymuconolactone decarboxylase family protein YurZ
LPKEEDMSMNKKEEETIRYYEKELGWVPPFGEILAKYSPGSLDGYLTMRKEVLKELPPGALPRKIKEMLFTILDCVNGEVNGAKAHARAAIDAGLTIEELVEGFVVAIMVTGITTMCKAGVEAINAAEQRFKERNK